MLTLTVRLINRLSRIIPMINLIESRPATGLRLLKAFSIIIERCGYVGESNSGLGESCGQLPRLLHAFSGNCPRLFPIPACCCAHIRPHIHNAYQIKLLNQCRGRGGIQLFFINLPYSMFVYIKSWCHFPPLFPIPSAAASAFYMYWQPFQFIFFFLMKGDR